jgi:hypothetical protein
LFLSALILKARAELAEVSASYFQERYSMLISKDKIMLRLRWVVLLALCLAIILMVANKTASALPSNQQTHTPSFTPKDAGQFDTEVPVAWFNLAYELARSEGLTPPVAARTFGYLGVALYEAIVPGMSGYQSLAGQLNGLEAMPEPADLAYHWPTVANSALAAVLVELLPGTEAAVQAQEAYFAAHFQPELPPGIFQRSVARGQAIGQAIGEWADADGYAALYNCPYSPPLGEGLWLPTPPGFAPALQPCWGQVRPFVLADGSKCNPGPPPAYSEEPDSLFYQEAWEVYNTVNNLTPEELEIAQFWADDPGLTGTPPGHSVAILSQVLVQEEASLALAAEAYARVGIAVADAFIACWWTKYEYELLRPVTYVHKVLGDTVWMPPVNTPPFPEYTSGHSVQSAATAQVLTDLFGEITFTDRTHETLGFVPRTFSSFFAYAEEAAISRLYGGIHFRAAIELGIEQGKCIGQQVSALQFRTE